MQLRALLITAAITIAAIAAAACGSSDTPDATATAEAPATATTTAPPPATATAATATATATPTTTTPPPATATAATAISGFPIVVKFSKHPTSDSNPAAVFDVPRVAPNSGVARYAIEQLLAGPTPTEDANGLFSTWTDFSYGASSDCGGDPFALTLVGGTITVRFCTTVTLLGSVADGQAETTITQTLLAFSTISKVVLLDHTDHCLFDASGMDLCLEP